MTSPRTSTPAADPGATVSPSGGAVRRGPVVYLHIGAPKSGTTFLQKVLWHNRHALARDGVLYPAERTGDHFRAALDLRGVRFRGYDDPEVPGSWRRTAGRVRRWGGSTVVISHELLAWASEDEARTAVESLRPAEVHIVYTARDLVRQLPAMWQESVKNGNVHAFHRYLRGVEEAGRGPGRGFWVAQDAVAVLGRWGTAVPPDRVHVLTVPQPDQPRDLLWTRFAALVGFDPDRYDTAVGAANASLGRAEVELLRRINRAVEGRLEWPEYEPLVKSGLAQRVLATRPEGGRISLPPRSHTWALQRSKQLVQGLRDAGYDVVGDLDELIPSDQAPPQPPPPGPGEVLDVAAETIVTLLTENKARSASPLSPRGLVGVARRRLAALLPTRR